MAHCAPLFGSALLGNGVPPTSPASQPTTVRSVRHERARSVAAHRKVDGFKLAVAPKSRDIERAVDRRENDALVDTLKSEGVEVAQSGYSATIVERAVDVAVQQARLDVS